MKRLFNNSIVFRIAILILLTLWMLQFFCYASNVKTETSHHMQPMPGIDDCSSTRVDFQINTLGKAICTGIVINPNKNRNLQASLTLQQGDGHTWKDIKTWSIESTAELALFEGCYYIPNGYHYRVELTTILFYSPSGRSIKPDINHSGVIAY